MECGWFGSRWLGSEGNWTGGGLGVSWFGMAWVEGWLGVGWFGDGVEAVVEGEAWFGRRWPGSVGVWRWSWTGGLLLLDRW